MKRKFPYSNSPKAPCACGSGKKRKDCCGNPANKFKARGLFDDGSLEIDRNNRRRLEPKPRAITRIHIGYTFPEQFGTGVAGYSFEIGTPVQLTNGYAYRVEELKVGMSFFLDNGSIGTVTEVGKPEVYGPPSNEKDQYGRVPRRVIGTVKHIGNQVIDLTFAGQTVTTTPGHRFYSMDRKRWVSAYQLNIGESLQSDQGDRLRLEDKSKIRVGIVELYNIEVEELHTYFVGDSNGRSILTHNGIPGPGGGSCIPKPQLPHKPTTRTIRQIRNLQQPAKWQEAENFIRELYGTGGEKHFPVPGSGGRFVDAPKDLPSGGILANEVKAYNQWRTVQGVAQQLEVPASDKILRQIDKDVWLRTNSQDFDPRWIFIDAPPSKDLSDYLDANNIVYVIYK